METNYKKVLNCRINDAISYMDKHYKVDKVEKSYSFFTDNIYEINWIYNKQTIALYRQTTHQLLIFGDEP